MARPYEVVYIFDPALDEETINQKLTLFHALVQVPVPRPRKSTIGASGPCPIPSGSGTPATTSSPTFERRAPPFPSSSAPSSSTTASSATSSS